MVPSLLPARSAPIGVSVVLSCLASCGETASAGAASPSRRANPATAKTGLFRRNSSGSVVLLRGDQRRFTPIMMPRSPMLRFTSARTRHRRVIGLLVLAWLGAPAAFSADLYHDCDLDVRWDNTLQYTAAYRLFPQDRGLLTNPNWDDGDRNFDPGLISNRLDLLSEFEATYGDFGLRLSGDGWDDTVYHRSEER